MLNVRDVGKEQVYFLTYYNWNKMVNQADYISSTASSSVKHVQVTNTESSASVSIKSCTIQTLTFECFLAATFLLENQWIQHFCLSQTIHLTSVTIKNDPVMKYVMMYSALLHFNNVFLIWAKPGRGIIFLLILRVIPLEEGF